MMEIIAKRIKELRKEKGITQVELAKAIGISQAIVSQYENSIYEPTASIIVKLADYFGVCTDYLLGRQDWY